MKINIIELDSEKLYSFDEYKIPFKGGIICKQGNHTGYVLNHEYGRCLYLGKEQQTNFELFVKGTGWNIGDLNFKQANWGIEFYLGLIEKDPGGYREWHTCNYYQKYFWATKVIAITELKQIIDNEGVRHDTQSIKYSNDTFFNPVNVFFISRSKYRISDWKFLTLQERKTFLEQAFLFLKVSNENEYLNRILDLITMNVALHHQLGGVNDTLGVQNYTLFGEITDFEDIFVPSIPFKDESWNSNIKSRQIKEVHFAIIMLYELFAYFQNPNYNDIRSMFMNLYNKILKEKDNNCILDYLKKHGIQHRI